MCLCGLCTHECRDLLRPEVSDSLHLGSWSYRWMGTADRFWELSLAPLHEQYDYSEPLSHPYYLFCKRLNLFLIVYTPHQVLWHRHTSVHTHAHMCTYAIHIHETHMNTYTPTCAQMHTQCIHTWTCTHMCIHIHTHSHALTCIHMHTHSDAWICIHIHTQAHTHAHEHAHTLWLPSCPTLSYFSSTLVGAFFCSLQFSLSHLIFLFYSVTRTVSVTTSSGLSSLALEKLVWMSCLE